VRGAKSLLGRRSQAEGAKKTRLRVSGGTIRSSADIFGIKKLHKAPRGRRRRLKKARLRSLEAASSRWESWMEYETIRGGNFKEKKNVKVDLRKGMVVPQARRKKKKRHAR